MKIKLWQMLKKKNEIITSKHSHTKLNSLLGHVRFTRHLLYCRHCKEGYAPFHRMLGVDETHKITKALKETVCDFAKRMSSFEEASYMIEKYL